jgi:hypothetical protein
VVEETITRSRREHLICGTLLWSLAGFAICAYFAHSSYVELRDGDFYWQSGWWTVLTWAVWLVLAAGLVSETRCWREGLLFGSLLAVFVIGLVFSAWSTAQADAARYAREASFALWSLAALASLATIPRPAQRKNT